VPALTEQVLRARRQDIGGLLERSAIKFPAKLAIVHDEVRKTYAELDDDVNRAANALGRHGVGRGMRVLIYMHNSYEFVVSYFSLARLGAISVPVNFNFTADEVAYALSDCAAGAAIVEARRARRPGPVR
jgi:fatty-acyl-CoA synthase